MADTKISDLAARTTPAGADLLALVDVADTTMAASGTTKKLAVSDLLTTAFASPALTGTPTAPTPAAADSTTKVATTAFVKAQGYLTAVAEADVAGLVADLALKVPRTLASGRYYFAYPLNTVGTSAALGIGTLRVMPCYFPRSVTLSRIGAEVTVVGDAGSKLRLGIYADDGTGYPGALVLDAGTIAGDSATVQEIVISQTLGPGPYWIGAAVQAVTTTQPTVRTIGTTVGVDIGFSAMPTAGTIAMSYSHTGATGALPSAFTATLTPGNSCARVFFKVS